MENETFLRHIQNIYENGEWVEENTIVQKMHNWWIKPTNYFNLDLILAVWYRIKSKQWVLFRKKIDKKKSYEDLERDIK